MAHDADRLLGFTVAGVCIVAGLALLSGLVSMPAPSAMRRSFGAILVLVGINRYVATRLKTQRPRSRYMSDRGTR